VDLSSLERLGVVEGELAITENDALTSLRGLSTLSFVVSLTITFNTVLPECEALRLRDQIRVGRGVEIAGNDVTGVSP
jgi:hypothetical protein